MLELNYRTCDYKLNTLTIPHSAKDTTRDCPSYHVLYSDTTYKTSRYKPLHVLTCCPTSCKIRPYTRKKRVRSFLRFNRRNSDEGKLGAIFVQLMWCLILRELKFILENLTCSAKLNTSCQKYTA